MNVNNIYQLTKGGTYLNSHADEKTNKNTKESKIKRQISIINILSIIVTLGVLFFDIPYRLMVLLFLIIPLIGFIFLIIHKETVYFDGENFTNVSPFFATLLPPLQLLIIADSVNLIYSFRFWIIFLMISSIIYLTILLINKNQRRLKRAIFLLFIIAMFTFGAVININTAFDNSKHSNYAAKVLKKTTQKIGRRSSTSYYLYITSWGPFNKENKIEVSKRFYNKTNANDTIFIYLKRGFLGIKWFSYYEII